LKEYPFQKEDEKISEIISKYADKYFKITKDCNDFFESEGKDIPINKLMNLFFIIEHLCFDDLCQNLQLDLKCEIPQEQKEMIKKKLLKNYDKKLYTLKDLAAAVRRYISRYLVGKRETIDIDETRDLAYDLTRSDLWKEKIGKLDNLDELINEQIGEFRLIVGEAYSLYQIISNEDRIELNIEENNENIIENNDNIIENNDMINNINNNIIQENNNVNPYDNIIENNNNKDNINQENNFNLPFNNFCVIKSFCSLGISSFKSNWRFLHKSSKHKCSIIKNKFINLLMVISFPSDSKKSLQSLDILKYLSACFDIISLIFSSSF
jgi:hypothetical protein